MFTEYCLFGGYHAEHLRNSESNGTGIYEKSIISSILIAIAKPSRCLLGSRSYIMSFTWLLRFSTNKVSEMSAIINLIL